MLEALLWHKVLSEDDLRILLNIQPKELRTICTKLMEDRLLAEYKQREPIASTNAKKKEREKENETKDKEGKDSKDLKDSKDSKDGKKDDKDKESTPRFHFQRHITKTYFFIHYSVAIDSIKWKVDSVVKLVDSELNKTNEKGFICPRCKKKYSELDIQSLFNDDFTAANCNICNTVLIEDDFSEQAKVKHAKSIKLKSQLDPVLQWLKKIDDVSIEDNSIESCFLARVPANDTSTALYTKINRGGIMFDKNTAYVNSQGKNGKNQFESTTIRVNIAGDNEDELRRQQERMKMKQDKAEQNALPSWYQESTVGKQALGKLDADEDENYGTSVTPGATATPSQPQDEVSGGTPVVPSLGDMNSSSTGTTPAPGSVSASGTPAMETTIATEDNNDGNRDEADELAAYYEKLKQQKEQEEEDDDDDDEDMDDEDFGEFEDV